MARGTDIPIRSCAACGQRLPKRQLIRIVRGLSGKVDVDTTGKLAGRGAYLCNTELCWTEGLSKGRLDRALRTSLSQGNRESLLTHYQEHLKPSMVGETV